MRITRRTPLLLGLSIGLAASLLGPAAAQASPLGATGHMPVALFGLDVGQLVGDIIRKLVDVVVPDLASHWAAALVKWLVAVPDVSDPTIYPHLNALRSGLVGVGFALLGCSITAAALQTILGATGGAAALKRAVIAAGVLVSYPKLFATAVVVINIATGELITRPLVIHGIDGLLGAALIAAAITGGVSLGLALGAATACMYFVAALMVIKIGLTAIEAFLLLSGALVWGLYPLAGSSWLARMWTAGAVTVALIPMAWALIFAGGALLSSDALLWSTSGKHGGLPSDLQQIVKPFATVACLWVAYKAPVALLAACRMAGLASSSVLPGGTRATAGRPRNPLAGAVQTNRDRFRAIGMHARSHGAPIAASARRRASALRTSAVHSAGQRLAPIAVTASTVAGTPSSARGRVFDDALAAAGRTGRGAARVAEGARTIAAAPIRANRTWRQLAEQGAAARQRATRGAPRPFASPEPRSPGAPSPFASVAPSRPVPERSVRKPSPRRDGPPPTRSAHGAPDPSSTRPGRRTSSRPDRPRPAGAVAPTPATPGAPADGSTVTSPAPVRPAMPASTPAIPTTRHVSPISRPVAAARPAVRAPTPKRPTVTRPARNTPSANPGADDPTPADRRPAT